MGSLGGLSSRGRRQRWGGVAAPSSSGIPRMVPSYDPRGGVPPLGVVGQPGSALCAGLCFEAARLADTGRCHALHRTARRPHTASFTHCLTHTECRCTVPQVATVLERQHPPGPWRIPSYPILTQACLCSMRDVWVRDGCSEGLEVGSRHVCASPNVRVAIGPSRI